MATNDEIILKLQKKIEDKEHNLSILKAGRVPTKTNCMFPWDGTTYNFNALSVGDLKLLKLRLHSLVLASEDLDMQDFFDIEIGGFPISRWICDLDIKIDEKQVLVEQKKLNEMKSQLDKMLSEDKKTELKLKEMAAWLE
ncbi:hypothetical protein KAMFAM_230 [Bacillus phage Kamfam]|nr:hypothetical protein OTK52_228 [Bacillus phage OTooleKemple52]AXQ67125.1 hypothetical protein KAMFAM_230 [Bacillus phage Kamfam]